MTTSQIAAAIDHRPQPASGTLTGQERSANLDVDELSRLVGLVEAILSARGKDRGDAVAETLVASFDGVLLGAASRPTSQRRPFVRQSMAVLMGGLG